jgi:hypothetical protein
MSGARPLLLRSPPNRCTAASDAAAKIYIPHKDCRSGRRRDRTDGGIADRGGGRGTYRVIDFNAGKFCSGHIARLASLAPGFRSEPSAGNWPRLSYSLSLRARARQSGGNDSDRAARPARAGGVVLRRWPAPAFSI